MKVCYEDQSFEKEKSMKKGDIYFSCKNTCILITTYYIFTFEGSPRKESLMDSNFSSKKKKKPNKIQSPTRLPLFKISEVFRDNIFDTFYCVF
jgi:hypothetical protein